MASKYIISCDEQYQEFYRLLLSRLREKSADLGITLSAGRFCGRHYCRVDCGAVPRDNVVLLICDIFSEILLVDFKHIYFKNNLSINIPDKNLSGIFYSSVTLYDREFDEELLNIRSVSDRELAVDSLIRFCTGDLSRRWKSVSQILSESFYGGKDKDAIVEFIKHIIYSVPVKTEELSVFMRGVDCVLVDENGRSVAKFAQDDDLTGKIASGVLKNLPRRVNLFHAPDTQSLQFLQQLFSDKVHFYVES